MECLHFFHLSPQRWRTLPPYCLWNPVIEGKKLSLNNGWCALNRAYLLIDVFLIDFRVVWNNAWPMHLGIARVVLMMSCTVAIPRCIADALFQIMRRSMRKRSIKCKSDNQANTENVYICVYAYAFESQCRSTLLFYRTILIEY